MEDYIYFIAHLGRIKIGTSKHPKDRIASLAAHYQEPIVFVGCIIGDRAREQAIHQDLAEHRLRGEWFRDCEEVRRKIGDLLIAHAFQKPSPPKITPPKSKDDKPNKNFGIIVRALWPENPAINLAQRIGCTQRAAQFYIDGQRKISARCVQAIVNEIVPVD